MPSCCSAGATSLALSKSGKRAAIGARRMDRLQELKEQTVKVVKEEEEEEKYF
jgi:NADP-dependent 3-hydroxy acid dehydrogenase YdfG